VLGRWRDCYPPPLVDFLAGAPFDDFSDSVHNQSSNADDPWQPPPAIEFCAKHDCRHDYADHHHEQPEVFHVASFSHYKTFLQKVKYAEYFSICMQLSTEKLKKGLRGFMGGL
jgi:hypothetical protein